MATLDDTCVIHRVGYARAMEVKDEAKTQAEHFDMDKLKNMCDRYAAEGISPGGAADMLALTIFMDSILN
jgi:triphosphoribosyl-dephospho-CoA synthetase